MKRLIAALAIAVMIPAQALAWGAGGHRIVGRVAIGALPSTVPGFVRTPFAVDAIGEFAREPDRSKAAGTPHDPDLDPNHQIDLDDEGKSLGGPAITALPRDRDAYETAMRAVGQTGSEGGFLPYSLMDGYQQLRIDFAYWRVLKLGETRGKTAAERAWYVRDRRLREQLTLRDLGYWAHFVGDGSQPQHVSMHYNGWGDHPNPKNYTQERNHSAFEGAFIKANVTEAGVRSVLPAPRDCGATIQLCTAAYIARSASFIEPLYQLWGEGGFKNGDPRGTAFATERLAAGAAELRDLIVKAWITSADMKIGYPAVSVKEIEAGGPIPFESFYGRD